jgi:nitroreductase
MINAEITGEHIWEAFRDRQPAFAAPPPGPMAAGSRAPGRRVTDGLTDDVLARRGSVREFATSMVPRGQILAAVAAAHDADAAVWPSGRHGAIDLEILIAASGIDGLARGLYAARETGTELLSPDPAELDTLRKQYTDAPALLLICANLNHACRAAGPAGYPAALVRAGAAGYAAWLWAISVGLAGCVYGGASHEASGAARQRDVNLRHLFTVALGMPARTLWPPPGRLAALRQPGR